MRALALFAALTATACNASPASLGITGPAAPPPLPATIDDSTILGPGIPDSVGGYGPSIGPAPSGRYFNYN
ncbi:MAG: hypothetical protein WDN25_28165 [Acetobacteraceae bacterium]